MIISGIFIDGTIISSLVFDQYVRESIVVSGKLAKLAVKAISPSSGFARTTTVEASSGIIVKSTETGRA